MKTKLLLLGIAISINLFGQIDTSFFPTFTPYSTLPIIEFGDFVPGSPWNDPCVIKESQNNYTMYMSGTTTGLAPSDTIKIYRFTSSDGYSWSLNPSFPVLKADIGTYYQAAIETPSVVKFNGTYHMYNTVYPIVGDITEFRISHSTSSDGINWTIDNVPFLERDSLSFWMNLFVGEPGAMIRNDTIYVFFTTMNENGDQTIGLAKTIDGNNILDTMNIISLPTDVYPLSQDYLGLSTPSATMVGDTIYLFTDVAQTLLGEWTQVALHQFKSYGDLSKWYHSSIPIHTLNDFSWTSGNYLSEIRAITPLMDGNNLRIWYAGNNLGNIDTVLNDTTTFVHFVGNELHADSGHWGIGTSEYLFKSTNNISGMDLNNNISIFFDGKNGNIVTKNKEFCQLALYTVDGRLILKKNFYNQTSFITDCQGMLLLRIQTKNRVYSKKLYSTKM